MGLKKQVNKVLKQSGLREGGWKWEGNKLMAADRETLLEIQARLRDSREFGPVYGNVLTLEIEIGERKEDYLPGGHGGLSFEEYTSNFERGLYSPGNQGRENYYDVIEETSLDAFILKVNEKVRLGYTLYGDTITYYDLHNEVAIYFQAFVRV